MRNVLCETFCAKCFVRNVLCETFCAKRFGQFFFWNHILNLGLPGLGGLGWAGLGTGLGLGWAGQRENAPSSHERLGVAGLGWAGLGWAGLGWAGWMGWQRNETEIGLFENGKVCLHRKKRASG